MVRKATKCGDCGDILWFRSIDELGQTVICPCGSTKLTEDGPEGNFTTPSAEETEGLE
jgi:hypothetical protein